MTAPIQKRFAELNEQLNQLQSNITMKGAPRKGLQTEHLPPNLILNWSVKVKTLLGRTCSNYLQEFIDAERTQVLDFGLARFERMAAVFNGAKEDFEGGYLNSLRNLVQAEVFTNELEQADELLQLGYATAAAVIAGVVLETTLRDLCAVRSIPHGKLDKMNADLAKDGAYNMTQQKRITALAGLRNSAAHGKPEEFTPADVKGMIEDVERFLAMTLQ